MKEAAIKFFKVYPSLVLTGLIVVGVWAYKDIKGELQEYRTDYKELNKEVIVIKEKVLELQYSVKYSREISSYENQVYADSLRKAIASQSSLIKNIPHRVNKNTNTKADSVVHNMERLFVDNVLSKGVFRRNSTNDFKEYPFNYFQK